MQKPSGSGFGASQEEISSMERQEDSRGSGGVRLQASRQPRGADRYRTAQQRTDESAVPLHIAVCIHVHAVLHDSVAVHGRHEKVMP